MSEPRLKVGFRGLALTAVIGVREAERHVPQPLEIDLCLELGAAPGADDLAQTVSYSALVPVIEAAAQRAPQLLETLAQDILARVLAFDPRIRAVEVEIRKPNALARAAHAFIRVEKSR